MRKSFNTYMCACEPPNSTKDTKILILIHFSSKQINTTRNMSRLNSTIHNSLTKDNLNALFSKKIFTTLNFLDVDTNMLNKITNLTFKEVLEIKKQILINHSAKVQNGFDYYNLVLKKTLLTPSKVDNLDNLLDGGFLSGSIYELAGFSSTGKTQLCLTIAVNISQYFQKPTFYLDTKRDFSSERLQSMLKARKCTKEDTSIILDRIKVIQIMDQYELISALFDIKKEFKSGFKCPLILIDSLPSIFYRTDDDENKFTFMNHFVNIIRYLSVEFHTTIIVTNLMVKDDSKSSNIIRPGLGTYWNNVPSTRILLTTNTDENNYKMTILKSTAIQLGKNCNVVITDAGVI